MISTVTTEPLAAADCTPTHWWRNLREPVRFLPAVEAAIRQGAGLFLEIGPNPILQSYLREALRQAGSEAGILASLTRREVAATWQDHATS